VPVEPPTEPGGDPALEGGLVLRRVDAGPHVRQDAEDRLPHTEVLQRVRRFQWIVEVLPVVVDPTHPRTQQEILGREDLVPQFLDGLDLGEEPVATDVETPPVTFDGARDATDDAVRLEDGRGDVVFCELIGGSEAGRPRPDDDDLGIGARISIAVGVGRRHEDVTFADRKPVGV